MIPALSVTARTMPEAWEQSVLGLWKNGILIPTEYDKAGDPHSRDATMMICILEPFAEPRIHRAIPCALEDLEKYRQEAVEGVHDHWIKPEEGKWTYTYHQRLFAYGDRLEFFSPTKDGRLAWVAGDKTQLIEPVNQIEYIIEKLCEATHTRRAQAITWIPFVDPPTDDPPCLQRVWCRISETNGVRTLDMNTHWRSRDAYKAAFMNLWGMTDLQRLIAAEVSQRLGVEIRPGRHVDISDSYHIYGSYFEDFEDRFLKSVAERSFDDRVWATEFAEPFFETARQQLAAEREKEQAESAS